MQNWEDRGIILSVRPHGDTGAIASVLTEEHGRWAGYVHGGQSSKHRGTLQIGNIVSVAWQSRVEESLGQFKLELETSSAAFVYEDRKKLLAVQSACAIADKTLSEREPCLPVASGLLAFLDTLSLENDIWLPAYIYWEIGLLRELGFGFDLSCCALTGETEDLAYVSPKTGRAATRAAGQVYKDKLLSLPGFLCGEEDWNDEDIRDGLRLTGYFLSKRVFAATHTELPESRWRLMQEYEPDDVSDNDNIADNEDLTA